MTRSRTFGVLLDLLPVGTCVDLGTGHGGFARVAAERGWTVTAVDARVDRMPEDTGITWVESDIRNVDLLPFDVIVCLGLFYHLTLEDQLDLLARSQGRPLILDTHVDNGEARHELSARQPVGSFEGRFYNEPGKTTSSWGNDKSFWPTLDSLHRMLAGAGYGPVLVVEPWYLPDRTFFLAMPDR